MKLAQQFIPAADEVAHLQRGQDLESQLFQKLAEQGHYGGRVFPSGSRQGIYVAAPNGVLLASVNTNDPDRMLQMMQDGLRKWNELTPKDRLLEADPSAQANERLEKHYPEGGLVLRVNSRDLPRGVAAADTQARFQAWNQDFAWFNQEEAGKFLPESIAVGAEQQVPRALLERLARCHLVDNVRGQTYPYDREHVKDAKLTCRVTGVTGNRVTLEMEGLTRTEAEGVWSIAGFRDMRSPTPQRRGMVCRLLGKATYDTQAQAFVEFELVAGGTRWGATQYNVRSDDLEPGPIGIVFSLAGKGPSDRVAPAFLRRYEWFDGS